MCLRHTVLEQRGVTIFLNQIMPVRFMTTNTTLMVMSTANFCLVINYVDNTEILLKKPLSVYWKPSCTHSTFSFQNNANGYIHSIFMLGHLLCGQCWISIHDPLSVFWNPSCTHSNFSFQNISVIRFFHFCALKLSHTLSLFGNEWQNVRDSSSGLLAKAYRYRTLPRLLYQSIVENQTCYATNSL